MHRIDTANLDTSPANAIPQEIISGKNLGASRETSREPFEMKTIGLLGGMSPESTIDYYQRINRGVRRALGSHHSARMQIYSANLEQVFHWMMDGDEESLGEHLVTAARGLEAAGADFVVMACNTAHQVAPQIEAAVSLPFVHIADVLGESLRAAGHRRVGLLASLVTAEAPFYRDRLATGYGVQALRPSPVDRREVDRVIREELCFHEIKESSRRRFEDIARDLKRQGAEAIALSCTEIGLLIETPTLAGLPVFDTTALHAERAVDLALGRRDFEHPSRAA